jgi:hypothetical protein
MPRNLYERVEVIFRLKDPALCQKVCTEILLPYFADTEKARFLLPSGQYARRLPGAGSVPSNGTRFNVQDFFIGLAEDREGLSALLAPALLEKLQSLPVYEALSKKWIEEPEAESQPQAEPTAR